MTIATLFGYLIGSRTAILRIAATRGAVWIGALLVFSAGLAREYDAADLVAEPWRLFVPFGASLMTSSVLYFLVYVAAWRRTIEPPSFIPTYVTFLSLYWMTAPFAWLYALPVERMMSAGNATLTNLCLLGVVSIWRVTLMTRVVHVLFGSSIIEAFWLVMFFADTVALTILYLTPIPILKLMGGIRLSESENVIVGTALLVGFAGVISWLIWFIGACTIIASRKRNWTAAELIPCERIRLAVWCFAACMILVWGFSLPFTQPEQRLRSSVEVSLARNDIAEAIHQMSQHDQNEFPPHWNPPPNLAYANPHPPLLDVLEVMLRENAAPWVRRIFVEKLESQVSFWSFRWPDLEAAQKDRQLSIIERLPEGNSLVAQHPEAFLGIAYIEEEPGRRERVRALLTKAGHDPDEGIAPNGLILNPLTPNL
jgi:hypothetical protein